MTVHLVSADSLGGLFSGWAFELEDVRAVFLPQELKATLVALKGFGLLLVAIFQTFYVEQEAVFGATLAVTTPVGSVHVAISALRKVLVLLSGAQFGVSPLSGVEAKRTEVGEGIVHG